jgi:hypothetical protein
VLWAFGHDDLRHAIREEVREVVLVLQPVPKVHILQVDVLLFFVPDLQQSVEHLLAEVGVHFVEAIVQECLGRVFGQV